MDESDNRSHNNNRDNIPDWSNAYRRNREERKEPTANVRSPLHRRDTEEFKDSLELEIERVSSRVHLSLGQPSNTQEWSQHLVSTHNNTSPQRESLSNNFSN